MNGLGQVGCLSDLPGAPDVVCKECEDSANPFCVAMFLEPKEKEQRVKVPEIRSNHAALLYAVGGDGGSTVLSGIVNVLGSMVELLNQRDDFGRHGTVFH